MSHPKPLQPAASLAILLLLGFAAAGNAQQDTERVGRRAPLHLVYDHLAPGLELRDSSGETMARSAGRQELRVSIPAGRAVVVQLRNANALLYRYDIQTTVVQERDLHACGRSTGRFAQQSLSVGLAAFQGKPPPSPLGTKAMEERVRALASSSMRARGAAERLTTAEAASIVASARAAVRSYADFSGQVASLAEMLEDSLAWIAEVAEWQPADSLLAGLHETVRRRAPQLSETARVAETATGMRDSVRVSYGALVRVTQAIESGSYAGAPQDAVAQEAGALRSTIEAAHFRLDSVYPQLQHNLDLLEAAQAVASQQVVIPPSDDVRRITIAVEPTTDFGSVIRLRQGRHSMLMTPRRTMACQVSIGFAMFAALPDYKVVDNTLVDASSRRQRFTPAMSLHVGRSGRPFGLLAGVGPGPDNFPSLYTGVSWSVFGGLFANVGAVWQRTPQLPAGFQLGQPLDPADWPGARQQIRPAIFFGASIRQ